ncbi:MAG: ABC transporter substrate-binding protein [Bacteroidales bacterium]|nr:ABC transporter substrate-binding protein [Bacteroidales bacterium]
MSIKSCVNMAGAALVAASMLTMGCTSSTNQNTNSNETVITVGTNTYAGFLPFMYLNNGLDPNEDCVLYKEYGLKMRVIVQDDFQAGRAALKNGDINLIYCTCDSYPVEMSEGSEMSDTKFVNISNWSRGADAIVASSKVASVSDLLGKVVACSEGTASNTLLLNVLEANGIEYSQINRSSELMADKVNLKVVASGLDAAGVFKAGQCDAAVVFAPDDQDIVSTMEGAQVLASTKDLRNIICDGLVAKSSWIEANRDNATKLIAALLYANSKMNTDEEAVKQAAKAFAKSYGTDEQFAIDGSHDIYYCTLGDEANFFGLNPEYEGIKGEKIYNSMANVYSGLKLCSNPMPWSKVFDSSIIEALVSEPSMVKGAQDAEK